MATFRGDGPLPADDIRSLPDADLAIALLKRGDLGADMNVNTMLRNAETAFDSNGEPDAQLLLERLSDAWSWLIAHGLIGPHEKQNPDSFSRVTARGRKLIDDESGSAYRELVAEDRLLSGLTPLIESKVRPLFYMGDFDIAALAAMRTVEVEVRRLSGLSHSAIGVPMMRNAFGTGGPLTDQGADGGEQVAMMELFSGALGTFKNPPSHRPVDYEDATEASEVILLADLLLRLLYRIERRMSSHDDEEVK